MNALSGTPGARAVAAVAAGCDLALYCSGVLADSADVLAAVPPLPDAGTMADGARPAARVTSSTLWDLALAIVPAVLAITLHEAAHGYAALALGDDTARRAGRLSLNRCATSTGVGTIILPGVLMLVQLATIHRVAFLFGWAKPVPVSAWRGGSATLGAAWRWSPPRGR